MIVYLGMDLKELIKKFEGLQILRNKFRKISKSPEISQLKIIPAHDINEDILDELKKSNEKVDKYQRANSWKTIALLILGAMTLFLGVATLFLGVQHTLQVDKNNTIVLQIELLKEQLQDSASMLFQQSDVLDSLRHQVRILEQEKEGLTKPIDVLRNK